MWNKIMKRSSFTHSTLTHPLPGSLFLLLLLLLLLSLSATVLLPWWRAQSVGKSVWCGGGASRIHTHPTPTHRDLPGSPRLAVLPSRSSLSGGSIRSPSPLLTPRSLSSRSLGGPILPPSGSPLLAILPSLSSLPPLGGPSRPEKAMPPSPRPLRNPSSLSSFNGGGPSLPDKAPPSPLRGPSLSSLSGGPSRPDNLIETPHQSSPNCIVQNSPSPSSISVPSLDWRGVVVAS